MKPNVPYHLKLSHKTKNAPTHEVFSQIIIIVKLYGPACLTKVPTKRRNRLCRATFLWL